VVIRSPAKEKTKKKQKRKNSGGKTTAYECIVCFLFLFLLFQNSRGLLLVCIGFRFFPDSLEAGRRHLTIILGY
jgi:hypothetical protein